MVGNKILRKVCNVYTVTTVFLTLSVLKNSCFGFTSPSQISPGRVRGPSSSIHRSSSQPQEQDSEEFGGFDDIRVNGTSYNIPDDVDRVAQKKVDETLQKEKTLYEILGAQPSATRIELKKCYIKLAKVTHPDAMVGASDDSQQQQQKQPEFSDVAAAWRVLGDAKLRKRYDRELRAKEFSLQAQKFADETLEQAVPAVAKMMDTVAVPFIRRTTATTWAVGKAVAKGVSDLSQPKRNQQQQQQNEEGSGVTSASTANNSTTQDITDTFFNAVKAGQDAGRAVDRIEISEKCSELEERADEKQKRGLQLEQELRNITEQRVFATLNYPTLDLSSDEAELVLERLDDDDDDASSSKKKKKSSKVGVGFFSSNNNIDKEIAQLREAEMNFNDGLIRYDETDREWHDLLHKTETAKADFTKRQEQEIEARKALERAQRMVSKAKAHLATTTNALKSVEDRVRRNAQEMDRVTASLSKRQDRVRIALRQKVKSSDIAAFGVDNLTEEDVVTLRRKELRLTGETKEVTLMVARLQSRAEKLKIRADALEKLQQQAIGNLTP